MKILFTDLDGTLLNDEKQIPEENSIAVKQTLQNGNAVVLCTGRSYFSAKKFVDRLGLNREGCYAILYNGGMIYDCCSGEILYQNTMPLSYVKYIFDQAARFGLYCQTYEGDYVVTPEDRPEAAQYHWSSQMEVRVDPDLLEHLKEEPVKVLTSCLDDRKKHEAYRDAMLPWAKGKVSIFFSSEYYLEHVMEGVSKGAAHPLALPVSACAHRADHRRRGRGKRPVHAGCRRLCRVHEKRHPGGKKTRGLYYPA